MKIVFDTNVLIAAFIAQGNCHEVYEHACLRHEIIISQHILNELQQHLLGKFHFSKNDSQAVIHFVRQHSQLVAEVTTLTKSVCRDHTDDAILALAKQTQSAAIITGDKDLLVLGVFSNIPIILPKDYWQKFS